MTNRVYVSTVRGAGLGLFLSALLFVITDQVVSFWLIPVGLALGLATGVYGQRSATRSSAETVTGWHYDKAPLISRLLLHPRVAVRFVSFLAVAAVLFVLAWYGGYYLLPEGALSGHTGSPGGVHDQAPSMMLDWLRMAAWNLVPMTTAVLASLFIRVRGIPLGYLALCIPAVNYGLTLGTNSFTYPMPERMAPSLTVLGRAGPYEFAAMILVVSATYAISRFELNTLAQTELSKNPDARGLTSGEWVAVGLGIVLLFAAALREAIMISAL